VPGGRLFIDVFAPRPAAGHEPMRYWRRGSYLWTLRTMHIEHDAAANQTTRFLRYDKWQDGTLRMTELQKFRLQHWSSQELEDLLAEADSHTYSSQPITRTLAHPRPAAASGPSRPPPPAADPCRETPVTRHSPPIPCGVQHRRAGHTAVERNRCPR
jgi:hypothetical protein